MHYQGPEQSVTIKIKFTFISMPQYRTYKMRKLTSVAMVTAVKNKKKNEKE